MILICVVYLKNIQKKIHLNKYYKYINTICTSCNSAENHDFVKISTGIWYNYDPVPLNTRIISSFRSGIVFLDLTFHVIPKKIVYRSQITFCTTIFLEITIKFLIALFYLWNKDRFFNNTWTNQATIFLWTTTTIIFFFLLIFHCQ